MQHRPYRKHHGTDSGSIGTDTVKSKPLRAERTSKLLTIVIIGTLVLVALIYLVSDFGTLISSAANSGESFYEDASASAVSSPTEEPTPAPETTSKSRESARRAVIASRLLERNNDFNSLSSATGFARQAIEFDPENIEAHVALAMSLLSGIEQGIYDMDERENAISAALATAMSLDPEFAPAWTAQARFQFIKGNPGAEELFAKALQMEPGNPRTLMEFGNSLRRNGEAERALPLLKQAMDLDPVSEKTLHVLGLTHDALNDFEGARAAYASLREINPANPLGYTGVSQTYLTQGQLDDALYWLREAQAVTPGDLELAGSMILLNDSMEDYEAAQEWSEWLDSRITNQALPMAMQAAHHYLTGNFQLAIQYSNLAMRLGIENQRNSGSIFMRIKRDEALANGEPEAGLEVFAAQHPELFGTSPVISADNLAQAVDMALLLKLTGRGNETRRLLEEAIRAYDMPGFTAGSQRAWLAPKKAEALAILGNEEAAIAELKNIIDRGWRILWRWETELNSNFINIRDSAGFKALIHELETDTAGQRARTQTLTDSGLIAPPPAVR